MLGFLTNYKSIFMKRISSLCCLLFIVMAVSAQKPVIEFSKKTYDFGTINEADGKVTTVFEFTNTGMAPLVVNRVRASCGCTTPNWTKTPIEPGQKGTISVTYNPAGRPGRFTKTITVSSNATESDTRLIIRGEVTPKPVDKSVQYPVKMDELGLKTNLLQFNTLIKGTEGQRTINVANFGTEDIRISVQNPFPYLEIGIIPEVLKPNETGNIYVKFNTNRCSQWGPVAERIYVILNDQKIISDTYSLRVRANIVEDFAKMTLEEKREAPIMEIANLNASRTIDVGKIPANMVKSYKISVANKGIKPLLIRRIVNNNSDMKVTASKTSISSGKKADIKFDINTKGNKAGAPYRRTFSIQTNDPENSYTTINLVWEVE